MFKNKPITFFLLSNLLVFIIIPIFLTISFLISYQMVLFEKEHKKEYKNISEVLSIIMKDRVYTYNKDDEVYILEYLNVNDRIISVRVYDFENILFLEKIYKSANNNNIIKISEDITFNGRKIGRVEVEFFDKSLKDFFIENKLSFLVIITILAISLFLFYIQLKLKILQPLKYINELTKQIGSNNLDTKIDKKYNDEIGELTDSFNEMRISLQKNILEKEENERILFQQSKLASMGEMIGNIAHQWRQPLNALGLIIQKIDRFYKKDKLNEEMMSNSKVKAMNLIKKMSSTIDDFRNFFKPNKIQVNFNISNIIIKTIEIVEASFEYNNIKIQLNNVDINYLGYPNELSQVILNILSNSKDAIVENKIKNGEVNINLAKQDKYITITISDNGGGISDNYIQKVFEPYFTKKEEGKGTGIGLYMSKLIVEEHMNGKISVHNIDSGAEFIIELPFI